MAKKKANSKERVHKVSARKIKMLNDIVRLFSKCNTMTVSSAQNIPSSQLQSIRSKLKGKASMIAVKKQIMLKAIEEMAKSRKGVKELSPFITEGTVLLFSDISPFELAGILSENKAPKKAKAGQVAPRDIEVEAGPTDMPAGPMISELSSLGLKVAIEGGKIAIKEPKVIVKAGNKITDGASNIMIKLDIMPFEVGLETLAAYDCKSDKTYIGIKVDKEEAEKKLKESYSNSRSLAFSIAYPAKEVIGMILSKAVIGAKAVESLANANKPTSS